MTSPVFTGVIGPEGQLRVDAHERAGFLSHLQTLIGKRITIVVKRRYNQRSMPQNKYYWKMVVTPLANHCGYEKSEMHELLAMMFLRIEDCPITGQPRRLRTPQANTQEFSDYLASCIQFAAEQGIVVTDSDRRKINESEATG